MRYKLKTKMMYTQAIDPITFRTTKYCMLYDLCGKKYRKYFNI